MIPFARSAGSMTHVDTWQRHKHFYDGRIRQRPVSALMNRNVPPIRLKSSVHNGLLLSMHCGRHKLLLIVNAREPTEHHGGGTCSMVEG